MTQRGKESNSNQNSSGGPAVAGGSNAGGGGGGGGKGGGGGRKRNRVGKRRERTRKPRGNRETPRGPPQSPQMKMTLRNIGNAEMYGRVSALTDTLLRSLIDKANERLPVDQRMLLNEANLQKHIQDEQAAIQAKEEWMQQQSKKGEVEEEEEKPDSKTNGAEEGAEAKDDSLKVDVNNRGKEAEKVSYAAATAEPKPLLYPPSKSSYLATRLLYVVTPKKTRRRGEKPGSVYLVLTAPPIKARTPPKPTPPIVEVASTDSTGEATSATVSSESSPKDVPNEAPVDGGAAPVAAAAEPATTANSETSSAPAAAVVAAAAPSNSKPPAVQQVDYSRDIAQRRLMLVRAVEALSAVAQQDATSKQEYAGCQVEESRNAKAWKAPPSESGGGGGGGHHYGRRDRLEGTLEDSADYKAFLESVVKEKEELEARPKPAPGGGTVAPSSVAATTDGATATATTENGEPIAALVMHLRTKQEEAKNRKKAKRKAKDASNANVKNIQQSGAKSSSKDNKASASKKEESGKKKKAKSKRKKGRPKGGGGAKSGGGGGGNSGGAKT